MATNFRSNTLQRLLQDRGWQDRVLALPDTQYVSGVWYSEGSEGRQTRSASRADGTPYVIMSHMNQNGGAGIGAKVSRAKLWGHWFLQNDADGTCRNASLLHAQREEMLATMSALKCRDCPEPLGLTAALAWSLLSGIAACTVLPRLVIGLPGCSGVISATSPYCKAAICLVTFVLALGFNGVLDAELGDMHSSTSRRRQHGISLYVSGNDDTGRLPGFSWELWLVALILIGWGLWVPRAVLKGVLPSARQGARHGPGHTRVRIFGRSPRTSLVLVVVAALVVVVVFDAEVGDMHSERHKRSPVGMTLYVTIPDFFFHDSMYLYYCLCLCVLCILARRIRRRAR
jgi:hypothetical protein